MTFYRFCMLGFGLVLAGCAKPDRVEITESRARRATDETPKLDVPYDQAFPLAEGYRWKTPPGWTRLDASEFRKLNFAFGPPAEGECYLSELPALADMRDPAAAQMIERENLNRWCAQMGQPALTDEQFAKLPTKPFLGANGRFLDLTGTFAGAAGAAPKADHRMLGLILSSGSTTFTVKMTGPAKLIEVEATNFDAFCASLRVTQQNPY